MSVISSICQWYTLCGDLVFCDSSLTCSSSLTIFVCFRHSWSISSQVESSWCIHGCSVFVPDSLILALRLSVASGCWTLGVDLHELWGVFISWHIYHLLWPAGYPMTGRMYVLIAQILFLMLNYLLISWLTFSRYFPWLSKGLPSSSWFTFSSWILRY